MNLSDKKYVNQWINIKSLMLINKEWNRMRFYKKNEAVSPIPFYYAFLFHAYNWKGSIPASKCFCVK